MRKSVKLKVCGMQESDNIIQLAKLQPDYMGFIFYPKSQRFAADLDFKALSLLPASIKKVGVFVNSTFEEILETVNKFGLNAVQLHGDETPEICTRLREKSIEVIKAVGVDSSLSFNKLNVFYDTIDYFLFDTKTPQYGGSGRAFDWDVLKAYESNVPYFLSGGLSLDNLAQLSIINDDRLYALDLNSRFETRPGFKDIEKLKLFFAKIKGSAIAGGN